MEGYNQTARLEKNDTGEKTMKKILGIMLSIVAFLVVSMICLGHTLADTDAVILFLKGEVGVKAVGTD